MIINKNLCPESKWAIKCPYPMTPTRIVVHNTANDASAANEISYMITNNNEVSFHYAVDDIQALQGILENRNSWNAGDGGNGVGNRQGISIEICYSKSGGPKFIKAEQNAVELIVDIFKRYGWGIDRVTKHQDYSGKYCPHRTLDMGWDRFINMVKAALNPAPVSIPVPAAIKYDKPQTFICNLPKVQMWDLTTNPNYKSAKEFNKGDEFIAYGYIQFNNTKYLVTEYSFNKGIKNGVNIFDMFNKTADDAQIEAERQAQAEKARTEALREAERLAKLKAEQLAIEQAEALRKAEEALQRENEIAEQMAQAIKDAEIAELKRLEEQKKEDALAEAIADIERQAQIDKELKAQKAMEEALAEKKKADDAAKIKDEQNISIVNKIIQCIITIIKALLNKKGKK